MYFLDIEKQIDKLLKQFVPTVSVNIIVDKYKRQIFFG